MFKLFLAKLRCAHKSLTIWANTLMLAALPLYEQARDALPQLQAYMPDNVYKWAGLGLVLFNIASRFRTRSALEDK